MVNINVLKLSKDKKLSIDQILKESTKHNFIFFIILTAEASSVPNQQNIPNSNTAVRRCVSTLKNLGSLGDNYNKT